MRGYEQLAGRVTFIAASVGLGRGVWQKSRRALALGTATTLAVLAVPTAAHADIVSNNVLAGGSPTVVAGGTTQIGYSIQNENARDGDTQTSCNPGDTTPATLTVSAPAAVTVTPGSRSFTSCGTTQSFGFSSDTPGSYLVSASVVDAGGGRYVTSGATFTLTVTKPVVVNTAPTVTVGAVTDGASYEFGNVPVAGCSVTDKEDGDSLFGASLSAITGPRASAGLGSQTASCSYDDAGGLNAKASATYDIVDTGKPLVTVGAPATTEATGSVTPVIFAAGANDAVDGNLPVTCKTTGGLEYASGDSFPVGTTTLTCAATDNAGNTGVSDAFEVIVVDTTAPAVTTPANIVVGNNVATVSYKDATATDLVDGNIPASCTPASGTDFALGTTTVTCTATDEAGNIGTNTFTVEVQDVTKPTVAVPANKTVEATGSDGATVTYDATADDDVDGTVDVSCSKDSGTVFPLGTTIVTCSAEDAAGNVGDSAFTVTVEDTTAPAVSVPADLTKEATSADGAAAHFGASASDAVDGSVMTICEPDSGSTFPLGATTVICSATDEAGNTGTDSFTVTVRDTTPPEVKVPANEVAEATGPDGARVAFGDVSASDVVDGPTTPSCSQASGTVFELGTTTVTCAAADAAGNQGTNSFTVTVQDTTKPDIRTPANLVVGNTSGTGAGNVVYAGASAEDLVSGNLPVSCTPASGSTFPLGINTVSCTATDAAGNTGTASFTIEVQDQTEPIVTVPADITVEATSASGATVSYIGVTAVDDVDGVMTAACSSDSGAVFPIGATTVTCSARDKAGNEGDNTFTVTVEDTTAPILGVSGARTAIATSANGAAVTYTPPTATDIVDGPVAANCDKASGSVFPLGTSTVTCSATDEAGNTGTERFTVTVTAAWSNVLQPVNANGSSIFKLGSTVPVKFQLTGASAGISGLAARLYLQRSGAGVTGSSLEAISTLSATTGNLFRYDGTSGQYIFNLSTKTLSTGTYQLSIDMGDGAVRTVNISIK